MICFFEDEPELNPHQLAWIERDWDALKKLVEEYNPERKSGLFEALNNINMTKDESLQMPEDYSSFMVNSMLSAHIECIPYVHYANMFLKNMPERFHYDYMMKVIPRGKRFVKSSKSNEELIKKYALKMIGLFYSVNHYKAYEYYELMVLKNTLNDFLKRTKGMQTDEFLKTITKAPKEIKELKSL